MGEEYRDLKRYAILERLLKERKINIGKYEELLPTSYLKELKDKYKEEKYSVNKGVPENPIEWKWNITNNTIYDINKVIVPKYRSPIHNRD